MKQLVWLLAACSLGAAQQQSQAPAPGNGGFLKQLSSSLEGLAHRVSPAVVQIFATGYALNEDSASGGSGVMTRQRASGSGVLLSADGYIVTNGHVVAGARRVRVQLATLTPETAQRRSILQAAGTMLEARVVGVDRDTDIAVIKIDRTGLPFLPLGDSDTLRQGQLVMAFGNPLGLDNSVSMGVVSSVARQIRPDDTMIYIQTDAPINPGNSGGPLVDTGGRVMGLNTFIFSQSGGSEGLGFAVPSNIVKNVVAQLEKSGHVHRAEIGISAQTITPGLAEGLGLDRDSGVIVGDVLPDGPAETAGVKIGDVVLALNGKPMENARQLEVNLYRYSVGQKVKLDLLRGKDQLTSEVPVVERQDDATRFADLVDPTKNLIPQLGILGIQIDRQIADLASDLRYKYGVLVAARAGDKPYAGPPLQPGDVIYSVNTETITSLDALRAVLKPLKEGKPAVLQIERNGGLMYLTLEME